MSSTKLLTEQLALGGGTPVVPKGTIVERWPLVEEEDIAAVVDNCAVALQEAEEMAGFRPSQVVIGIAGAGDDHLALLARIAEIFVDADRVVQLRAARSPEDVMEVLHGVRV